MKVGGNQAGAFPDLPIQPRNLDFSRKIQSIAFEMFLFFADFSLSAHFLILLTPVLIFGVFLFNPKGNETGVVASGPLTHVARSHFVCFRVLPSFDRN